MEDDIENYDWTQGGGDPTYFGGGDTSWIDNFNWNAALDNLDFSNLDLSSVIGPNFSTDFFNDVIPNINSYVTDYFNPIDTSWLSTTTPATNYLTDGVSMPGQGLQGPSTSLYQTESEPEPTFLGEGLKEPETPGMTYLGGGQGLVAEIPTQYDENGEPIPGTGGYITQMGFIPYDATPALGDPRSFINDPKNLGRAVFTTDGIKLPDGTTIKVDPSTGKTTVTPGSGKGGGGGGSTKPTTQQQLKQFVDARRISMQRPDIPELERFTPGRGTLFNPLAGAGEIPMARIDIGSIGNIFPSESVLDRLSGQMPIRVAEGGSIEGHNPEFYSEGGHRYVRGDGDGTSDSVPAMLARGEYVIPADVVSSLGNGDNEAGAEIMDEFLQVVRQHKRDAEPGDLPEDSKGPLSYLAEAQENLRD